MAMLEEGVRSVRKELRTLDKMLIEIEKGNYDPILEMNAFFLSVKTKTDNAIEGIISSYKYEQLQEKIKKYYNTHANDVNETLLLATLIDRTVNQRIVDKILVDDRDSFKEEHIRYLLSVYMKYINSSNMRLGIRRALHNFMLMTFSESQYIRDYFSGNADEADKVSNPDRVFGSLTANLLAEKEYYSKLNSLIKSTNGDEMFEGLIKEDLLEAKKIKTQLEFAALCLQMEERNIKYPVSSIEMSDYTKDLMTKAANLVRSFQTDEKPGPRMIIDL